MKLKLRKRLGWALVILAFSAAYFGATQQLPFVIVSPGSVYNVLDSEGGVELLKVDPPVDSETPGIIDLLTVYETGYPGNTPYLWELVPVLFSEDSAIYPLELEYPDGQTLDDLEAEAAKSFEESQKAAKAAASTVLPKGTLETHKVTFGLSDVGGPSGGLAFTLGIVDKLSPGSLTGGKRIAVTGTIDASGIVGPIGGIQQKIYAASGAGDQFFIVPKQNCEDLTAAHLRKIRVIPVSDLNEALSVLKVISSDGEIDQLAVCPAK